MIKSNSIFYFNNFNNFNIYIAIFPIFFSKKFISICCPYLKSSYVSCLNELSKVRLPKIEDKSAFAGIFRLIIFTLYFFMILFVFVLFLPYLK
jgi:hypothetical protein